METNTAKYSHETILAKNVKLLKNKSNKLWRLIDADQSHKSGEGVDGDLPLEERIKRSKLLFYGSENPVEVVSKAIEGLHFEPFDTVFLIGLGLGYLPIEAFNKGIGSPRMIIIEPSIHVFIDALACIDLDALLENERIELFVGDEIKFDDIINRFRLTIPLGKNPIIVHPKYDFVFSTSVEHIRKELSERIVEVMAQSFTVREHGKLMFRNTMANLPSLFSGTPMRRLRDKFQGVPAICVSAGPSLDQSIEKLRQVNHRALIIACDSAVNALVNAGITPHVVVTIDMFEANIHKLRPYVDHLRETVFIFGLESNPDNVRLFLSPRRIAISAYSRLMAFWLDPQLNLQSRFPVMCSVSHLALFSALAMGADPIVMVGMDLGFVDGKSHSFGSVFFRALDQAKTISVYGNSGNILSSSNQFIADRLLIENMARQQSARIINTSIDGAFVSGTTIKSLSEVMDVEVSEKVNVNYILDSIDWACVADESSAVSELNVFAQLLKGARDRCRHQQRLLSTVLKKAKSRGGRTLNAHFCQKAEEAFKAFEKDHLVYKNMNMGIMLGDLQEIAQLRETLSARLLTEKDDAVNDRIALLVKEYDVFERGVNFQVQEIEGLIHCLEEVSALKQQGCGKQAESNTDFQLEKCYHRRGELWQAYREYLDYIKREPRCLQAYVDLIQRLMEAKLWPSAHRLILEAQSILSPSPEIDQLEKEASDGIGAIFEKIIEEWNQDNIHATRKLLAEYMLLRPTDSKAIELRRAISELDRQHAAQWKEERTEAESLPAMPECLRKAASCVKERHLEKGIGILEGMYRDFQESRATIREQIGDIRMMQKDYQSAMWNYKQARKIDPLKLELNTKIKKLSSIHEARIG